MKEFPAGCNPSRLRGLLDDTLPEAEELAVVEHLGGCGACQRELEGLAADDPWWTNLRRFAPREPESPGGPVSATDRTADAGGLSPRPPTASEPMALDFLAPSDDPRFVGRLGRYEGTGIVGQGGMGLVLRAFDPPLNRYVAIKVLAPQLAAGGAARKRFAREAKAAPAVAHEHVVPIYAVDESGGLPYLVMPYVSGR